MGNWEEWEKESIIQEFIGEEKWEKTYQEALEIAVTLDRNDRYVIIYFDGDINITTLQNNSYIDPDANIKELFCAPCVCQKDIKAWLFDVNDIPLSVCHDIEDIFKDSNVSSAFKNVEKIRECIEGHFEDADINIEKIREKYELYRKITDANLEQLAEWYSEYLVNRQQ